MAKYLIQASYTADGLKGLMKDKASGRQAAIKKAVDGAGGSVECFYFSFGGDDVVAVIDAPDNATVAALSVAISSTGLVRIRTTPLLTVEEVDKGLKQKFAYRAPGQK